MSYVNIKQSFLSGLKYKCLKLFILLPFGFGVCAEKSDNAGEVCLYGMQDDFLRTEILCGRKIISERKEILILSGFFPRSPFAVNGRFRGFKNKRHGKAKIQNYHREEYKLFISELKTYMNILNHKDSKPALKNLRLTVYWKIGERIFNNPFNMRGNEFLKQVALDINAEFETLKDYIQFYSAYKKISVQLEWEHYLILLRENNIIKQKFYHALSVINSWSPSELKKSVEAELYESCKAKDVEQTLGTFILLLNPDEILKDYMSSDSGFFDNNTSEQGDSFRAV